MYFQIWANRDQILKLFSVIYIYFFHVDAAGCSAVAGNTVVMLLTVLVTFS